MDFNSNLTELQVLVEAFAAASGEGGPARTTSTLTLGMANLHFHNRVRFPDIK
ncbi:hypothetical protein C439_16618 [Haloferax mediterranei ATCC 33500]|uniref:Uncharacterized protein n=1 Tax=Haloferax mediterranei (strain ATCC 33500 / DSM 1411 / JCM 8866 / NBRC 14739 / NCIMB 2177 / R-4) TaxID=523841 RepID=I3R959_HALMT|nr:hypothetical protein HFX_4075 [Haloferax mediterranei ATCC 33500]ELZ97558.1 hypothetical protein C439_16618 [Haloferax mediterranei ATCC 33500]